MSTYYYTYKVMGTPNKKTGRIPKYDVKLRYKQETDERRIVSCNCKARDFRPNSPCKHMKLISSRLGHKV